MRLTFQQGTYTVTITDRAGCTAITGVLINQPDLFTISVLPSDTICLNDTIELSVVGNGGNPDYTFTWNNGLGTGAGKKVSPTITTTYVINATDSKGCLAEEDSTTIKIDGVVRVVYLILGSAYLDRFEEITVVLIVALSYEETL